MKRFVLGIVSLVLASLVAGSVFVLSAWANERVVRFREEYYNEPDPRLPYYGLVSLAVMVTVVVMASTWSTLERRSYPTLRRLAFTLGAGSAVLIGPAVLAGLAVLSTGDVAY